MSRRLGGASLCLHMMRGVRVVISLLRQVDTDIARELTLSLVQ